MEKEDQASYEESSFCIDAKKLKFNQYKTEDGKWIGDQICIEDYPSLIHEWWHYIQDVFMASAQHGFYLWIRDIERISSKLSNGQGKTFKIPFPKDFYDQNINKDREVFNIICGEEETFNPIDPHISDIPTIVYKDRDYEDGKLTFALSSIVIDGKPHRFGLLALQELNAFYIQKIAESFLPGVKFTIPTDSMKVFPYHLGDLLFDYHEINADLRTKFVISSICLDTIQAPEVFLDTLKELKGKSISIDDKNDLENIYKVIYKTDQKWAPNSGTYYCQWLDEYKRIIDSKCLTPQFRESLKWYVSILHDGYKSQEQYGADIFPRAVSVDLYGMNKMFETFPAPLLKKDGIIQTTCVPSETVTAEDIEDNYHKAIRLWMTRRVYCIITCKSKSEFEKLIKCPLFKTCVEKEQKQLTYFCKNSCWDVMHEDPITKCNFGWALYNLGLWQNSIEIDIDSLE